MDNIEFTVSPANLDDVDGRAVVELEAQVFYEWFGNTREQLDNEYSYLTEQMLLVLGRSRGVPVCFMRLCLPGEYRQKSLRDMEDGPFGLSSTTVVLGEQGLTSADVIDLLTIGVAREARGNKSVKPLLGVLVALAARYNCSYLAAVVDVNVMNYLDRLGLSLEAAPGAGACLYLGSIGVPILSPVDRLRSRLPGEFIRDPTRVS